MRTEPVTDKLVANIVKQTSKVAGLEPLQFSGHSLRAGFVTQAYQDGVQEGNIAAVGA